MLASSYPLLDIFLTTLYIFLFIVWLMILFQVITDLFRSHDLSGGMKAVWFIFILLLPFLGVLVYLIARGGKMHEHQAQAVQAQQKAMDDYIRTTAGSASAADELAKLADLHAKGSLSDAEYEAAKKKIIHA